MPANAAEKALSLAKKRKSRSVFADHTIPVKTVGSARQDSLRTQRANVCRRICVLQTVV